MASSSIQLRVLHLGNAAGSLLVIPPFTPPPPLHPPPLHERPSEKPPEVIVVLDRSGSMGSCFTPIISGTLPDALDAMKISEIKLITFDTKTTSFDITPNTLRHHSESLQAQGCTNMAPSIHELLRCIQQIPLDHPIVVFMMSDGEVDDEYETSQAASQVQGDLKKLDRTAPTSVITYRIFSSGNARPDTGALASVGCLDTGSALQMTNIDLDQILTPKYDHSRMGKTSFLHLIVDHYKSCNAVNYRPVRIEMPGGQPLLQLNPFFGTRTWTSEGNISAGTENIAFLSPEFDLSRSKEIKVAGCAVEVIVEHVTSEKNVILQRFGLNVQNSLKLFLAAKSTTPELLHSVRKWVDDVTAFFQSKADVDAGADGGGGAASRPSTQLRLSNTLSALRKYMENSLLHDLRTLANADMLETIKTMNAENLAEFLIKPKLNLATVKRSQRSGGDIVSLSQQGNKEFLALRTLPPHIISPMDDSLPASYITLESNHAMLVSISDCLKTVVDPAMLDQDENFSKVLGVLGLLGIAFRHPKSPYPDPWNVPVYEVYSGTSYLTLADSLTARGPLEYPGFSRSVVTGVIPLRIHGPESYDHVKNTCPNINKAQVSLMLRDAISAVPGDEVALNAAVLHRLAIQMTTNPLRQIDVLHYHALQDQLVGLLTRDGPPLSHLTSSSPRAYFNGEYHISGFLKPLTYLLFYPEYQSILSNLPQFQRVILDIYELAMFRAASRAFKNDSSSAILAESFFGVLLEPHVGDPGTPDVDPPAPAEITDSELRKVFEHISEKHASWIPKIEEYEQVVQVRRTILAGKTSPEIAASPIFEDPLITKGMAFLLSLRYPTESDRIPDKKAGILNGPPLSADIAVAKSLITEWASAVNEKAFNAAIADKRKKEKELRIQQLVRLMVTTKDLKEFIASIGEIPNREAYGYSTLEEGLLDLESNVPLQTQKLIIFLLGRESLNPDAQIVAFSGNVYRENMLPHQKVFERLNRVEEWKAFTAEHSKYKSHTYRKTGSNRHGHSNAKPSYWAIDPDEYPTLEAFRDKVSKEVFDKYCEKHKGCCGL